MSSWNWPGYAKSPEARYVQSLTEEQLFTMIRNLTGEEYDLSDYPGHKKGGLIGALNNIAIKHLITLTRKGV